MINKITIIGVGLIGGSLAKALKKHNFAQQIIGFGRNKKKLKIAKDLGIIDDWTLDPKTAITTSEIIILAIPVNSFKSVLQQIKPFITNQLITDVGSTKQSIVSDVRNILGEVRFVPAHPIAGKEKTSFIYADENLFMHKKVIITSNNKDNIIIKKMWQLVGGIVEIMDSKTHDDIFALTSHLPHILAFSFVNYMATQKGLEKYTGGGFKDFSRIASSNSIMWAGICFNNKTQILKHLDNYQKELKNLSDLIKKDEIKIYQNYFKNAKDKRNSWMNNT